MQAFPDFLLAKDAQSTMENSGDNSTYSPNSHNTFDWLETGGTGYSAGAGGGSVRIWDVGSSQGRDRGRGRQQGRGAGSILGTGSYVTGSQQRRGDSPTRRSRHDSKGHSQARLPVWGRGRRTRQQEASVACAPSKGLSLGQVRSPHPHHAEPQPQPGARWANQRQGARRLEQQHVPAAQDPFGPVVASPQHRRPSKHQEALPARGGRQHQHQQPLRPAQQVQLPAQQQQLQGSAEGSQALHVPTNAVGVQLSRECQRTFTAEELECGEDELEGEAHTSAGMESLHAGMFLPVGGATRALAQTVSGVLFCI